MKSRKTSAKPKCNPLPIAAGIVLVLALAVTLLPRLTGTDETAASQPSAAPESPAATVPESPATAAGSGLVIETGAISTQASFFDYDADDTTVQVFAVRASDGSVRLALNTCQVCNGSPYAYFVQEGDYFVCQNCLNHFSAADVGRASGGCNPVPVTADDYTEQDGAVTIPAAFLAQNAYRFTNWKKF